MKTIICIICLLLSTTVRAYTYHYSPSVGASTRDSGSTYDSKESTWGKDKGEWHDPGEGPGETTDPEYGEDPAVYNEDNYDTGNDNGNDN